MANYVTSQTCNPSMIALGNVITEKTIPCHTKEYQSNTSTQMALDL